MHALHSPESTVKLVASCMLAALETNTDVDSTEQAVITFLNQRGEISTRDAHVEYGCLEHGVVHVCYGENFDWICLDPADGSISKF